jgi:hypothetical protein
LVAKVRERLVVSKRAAKKFDKTYCKQFITKNKSLNKINIEHGNTVIIQTNFVKFWGITVDNTPSWKQHIDIPKLNKACYAIRRSKFYLSHAALKMVYYAFFSLSNVLWFDFLWKFN